MKIELCTGGVSEALPLILAALGEILPTPAARPVAELLLVSNDPKIEEVDGKRRATATAQLIYEPVDLALMHVAMAGMTGDMIDYQGIIAGAWLVGLS